jgi:hypothetical protein
MCALPHRADDGYAILSKRLRIFRASHGERFTERCHAACCGLGDAVASPNRQDGIPASAPANRSHPRGCATSQLAYSGMVCCPNPAGWGEGLRDFSLNQLSEAFTVDEGASAASRHQAMGSLELG